MHFTDAAVLGMSLITPDPIVYLEPTKDGHCGCLIGGAVLAAGGKTEDDAYTIFPWLSVRVRRGSYLSYMAFISRKFTAVCEGRMTFEALIAYCRRVEPTCGACCSFKCSCVKAEAEEVCEVMAYV